jgi:hypothetical protein
MMDAEFLYTLSRRPSKALEIKKGGGAGATALGYD